MYHGFHKNITHQTLIIKINVSWAHLFKKFNLDKNDLDLDILCFVIQDQLNHSTFVPCFKAKLDWIALIQIHQIWITIALQSPWGHGDGKYEMGEKIFQCFCFLSEKFCVAFTRENVFDREKNVWKVHLLWLCQRRLQTVITLFIFYFFKLKLFIIIFFNFCLIFTTVWGLFYGAKFSFLLYCKLPKDYFNN